MQGESRGPEPPGPKRVRRPCQGRPAYQPVLEWGIRELSDRFSVAILQLVRDQHPGILDGDGAP